MLLDLYSLFYCIHIDNHVVDIIYQMYILTNGEIYIIIKKPLPKLSTQLKEYKHLQIDADFSELHLACVSH